MTLPSRHRAGQANAAPHVQTMMGGALGAAAILGGGGRGPLSTYRGCLRPGNSKAGRQCSTGARAIAV